MEKKGHVGHRCRSGRWGGVFLSAILLAAGLAFPDAGRAASSGPGVWDFMIYGNYDLVSPNSGAALSNEERESAKSLVRQARGRQVADIVRLAARRDPNKIALIYEGIEDAYRGLDQAIDNSANALRQRGVKKGDRVAILSHNNRAFVILRFATARLGAILTPINFMLNAGEIAFIIDHSGAVMCLVEDSRADVRHEARESTSMVEARNPAGLPQSALTQLRGSGINLLLRTDTADAGTQTRENCLYPTRAFLIQRIAVG